VNGSDERIYNPFCGAERRKAHFEFSIDNTFFAHFEFTDFDQASLKAFVLDKKSSFLELHFEVQGPVVLPCDVSTEFLIFQSKQFDLIVKFGSIPPESNSDEILVLPEGSYQINVAQFL